ncbi:MAG: flagellar biosynthetic protein FliR [Proteobacteria bacterium]|nr:flagellar biosynthetic protein FliR [Pseudomonadota bacterium]
MMLGVAILALRGAVAIAVLTTLAGGLPRVAQAGVAVGIGLWAAVMAASGGSVEIASVPPTLGPLVVAALRELAIGGSIGVAAAIPLLAAATAGRLVDLVASSGRRGGVGPYSGLFGILAAAVFVGIDGHAMVIGAIVESFRVVPPMGAATSVAAVSELARLVPIAVTLAIPWLVTAVVVEIAIGSGMRLANRAGLHAPTAAAVPAAIAMMTATLVGTLAVAIAAVIRH